MKKLLISIFAVSVMLTACNTTQQKVAVNTLATIEHTTTAAVDSYDSLVIKGVVPTNDVPTVTRAFNTFQKSFILALDAVQYNTNAIAPPALAVESQDLVNLINTIINKK